MESIIFISVAAICVVFILVSLAKKRPDKIVDFALRACLGTAGICLLDFVLGSQGYDINVGVNGITVLTNGLLGLPGFILLYGLSIYYTFT
ncbi:MAG TPA: pro-sigmaK processing inhibitor BofA family protein [Mobilitalea sp.]|nr:pro-sigmaK processing inhibitor BofA family protein [Mobilitalea sp.]